MKNNLVWIAFTMFREYYISLSDGNIYEAENVGLNTPFRPVKCNMIPESAEYISYPVSYPSQTA